MIKQSVINYFKCLKYVFTPLGVIALGVMIGMSILIPGTIAAVKDMCDEIIHISSVSVDFSKLIEDFVESVRALDWSDIQTALGTLFSKEWWIDTFSATISSVVTDFETYAASVMAAIIACIDKIISYLIILAVFTVLGFIVGTLLTRWLIRRDIAKRALWKFFLNAFAGAVLSALYIAFTMWLYTVWTLGVLVCTIVGFILSALVSLTEAYIVHGFRKVKFTAIVNLKNAAKLILSDMIIFVVAIAIVITITLIFNAIVGLFVALGIITVTLSVMLLNAEAYVKLAAENAVKNAEQHITVDEAAATDDRA